MIVSFVEGFCKNQFTKIIYYQLLIAQIISIEISWNYINSVAKHISFDTKLIFLIKRMKNLYLNNMFYRRSKAVLVSKTR